MRSTIMRRALRRDYLICTWVGDAFRGDSLGETLEQMRLLGTGMRHWDGTGKQGIVV